MAPVIAGGPRSLVSAGPPLPAAAALLGAVLVGALARALPPGARALVRSLCVRVALGALMVSAAALLVGLGVGPRTGRYRTLTMLSGSMVPTYPVGSVLIDVPERPSDLRVGQVITFQVPTGDHRVESHRVFKVVSGGAYPVIQTKGDANPAPDPWTVQVQDTTVWRVRAVVPGLGRVIVGLRHPAVRKVLVLGIPALLAVLALTEIWRTPGVPARARHQGEAPARA